MGFYTGCTGSLSLVTTAGGGATILTGAKPVAKVRDWSIETSLDMLETTTLENCTKTFIPSTKSTTGSATLMYYRLETGESTAFAEFTALLTRIHKTGQILPSDRIQLTLKTSAAANDDIVFNAYITNAQISMSPNELVTVPIQFQVDGDFLTGGTITAT